MYIRTKNGVYVLSEAYWAGNKDEILAEADTIEELCDEYVIPRYQDTFIIDRFSKQICLNHIKCGYGDVYGAIWCEWGLKYVAKLDDKGLHLL